MGWLHIDLGGRRAPVPRDSGCARFRRLVLREQLLCDPRLSGDAALAIVSEIQILELREATESLQDLLYSDDLCNIPECVSPRRAA